MRAMATPASFSEIRTSLSQTLTSFASVCFSMLADTTVLLVGERKDPALVKLFPNYFA